MTAPVWLHPLFAWKNSSNKKVLEACGKAFAPNIADVDNKRSLLIARSVFDDLQVTRLINANSSEAKEENRGTALENAVTEEIEAQLSLKAPHTSYNVARGVDVWTYEQYKHLSELRKILSDTPSLRVTLGTDYQITPDITVGIGIPGNPLHAVISCKWTLRSDRAQNIRHEFNLLVRSRRGRAPHLVAVTAEPLPSRLASLTRGTGEIDSVYHVAFNEMQKAVTAHGSIRHNRNVPSQLEYWQEMTEQNRLRDFNDLVSDLLRY
ncbi:restriction endonuclease [Streptomyces sp. NA04227]|uniref:NgoMIV family type II restriction endonuclease n=1 Tax=Streptomyces sp. NA04227 TaxID=2742136 RepID=UPI0015922726|nr:NgoMIV family type II restriction endonuclease [Streptomyces sp. NA04227]QKW06725.1 restriction endonuclease [Streptomyces sp. NA04227]